MSRAQWCKTLALVLLKVLLGHAEVMADFMDQGQPYLFYKLIFGIADRLDVFLVENDRVRQRGGYIEKTSLLGI
jgi:hypothetical protein